MAPVVGVQLKLAVVGWTSSLLYDVHRQTWKTGVCLLELLLTMTTTLSPSESMLGQPPFRPLTVLTKVCFFFSFFSSSSSSSSSSPWPFFFLFFFFIPLFLSVASSSPFFFSFSRDNISIGTWNTRILRAAGKLQELTHKMVRYRWNILGLCEMRWKNFGETTTEEGHKVFFSGKEDKHERGVGFLVHKDIVNTVMGCRPVSNRLITICLGQSLSTSQ